MIAGAQWRARRIGVPVSVPVSTAVMGEDGNVGALAHRRRIAGVNGEWLGKNGTCSGIVAHGKASTPRAVGVRAGSGPGAPAALHSSRRARQPLPGTRTSSHDLPAASPDGEPLTAGARP